MAMSEKSTMVLNYLKSVNGSNVTAADVAEATGLERKSVDPCFTSLVKKGLGERVEAEIELADGTHKKVKFLVLNDQGMAFDPTAETAPAKAE